MPAHKTWTPEMEATLREGIARREWSPAIAKKLGKTKNAVIGKARRMGLRWTLSPAELRERKRYGALRNPHRFAWAAGQRRMALGIGGVHSGWDI